MMAGAPASNSPAARALAIFDDSITTDHISPAGAIKATSPAGSYLRDHGVPVADFNSYGARRGNHEVMVRGTFANVRIRNLMVPGVEGGITRHQPDGERMGIYDAAERYRAEGVPLIVIAGQDYGAGSSRDWAAKGTRLLGVRAVIARGFERIHRSNLIGMGVLPCQFPEGVSAQTLELDGTERFDLELASSSTSAPAGDPAYRTPRRPARFRTARAPDRHANRGCILLRARNSASRARATTRAVSALNNVRRMASVRMSRRSLVAATVPHSELASPVRFHSTSTCTYSAPASPGRMTLRQGRSFEAVRSTFARLSADWGSPSSSNHGCFLIQITLRQLGCGSGKNCGPYSENALTVSVIEVFGLGRR